MNYSDIQRLKKEYDEQRIIEKYQVTRTLPRPTTTRAQVVLLSIVYIATVILACCLFSIIDIGAVRISLYVVFPLAFSEIYLRFLGVKIVECYQHYASDETRRRCLCVPSCSEYAILCLKKYPLVCALVKIRHRLYVTCKGDTYILDFPYENGLTDVLERQTDE